MNLFNKTFFIYKTSYINGEIPDVGFIPMMMRRKLSSIGKAALYVMYDVYENDDIKLVYASNYGEIERVKKLLEQKNSDGEVSPTGFSFSVHNSSVGLFSLLNKINSSYNSVSAGENTFATGLLESILNDAGTLFCFAESIDGIRSFACVIGQKPRENAIKVELLENNEESQGFYEFMDFLQNDTDFSGGYYKLRKVK